MMRPILLAMGSMLLATAATAAATAAAPPSAAQVQAGQRLFARCAGCHEVGPRARNGFGPALNGVLGRKAGSVAGYAYSPALKNAQLVWDQRKLVAFIRDSSQVVPGNKMRFLSFLSEKQAADIVAYLGTQGAAPAAGAPARK